MAYRIACQTEADTDASSRCRIGKVHLFVEPLGSLVRHSPSPIDTKSKYYLYLVTGKCDNRNINGLTLEDTACQL